MRLRSKGLGRKELVLDFREYVIAPDGDDVMISGTITDPVTWDFTIRVERDDIPGMLRVALSRRVLALALAWVRHPRRARVSRDRSGREATGEAYARPTRYVPRGRPPAPPSPPADDHVVREVRETAPEFDERATEETALAEAADAERAPEVAGVARLRPERRHIRRERVGVDASPPGAPLRAERAVGGAR